MQLRVGGLPVPSHVVGSLQWLTGKADSVAVPALSPTVIPSSGVIYGQRVQHQRRVPHVMRETLIPGSLGSGHCGSGWPGGRCLHLKRVSFAPRVAGLSPGREGGGQGTFHRVKAASLRISTSSHLLPSREVTTISSTCHSWAILPRQQ